MAATRRNAMLIEETRQKVRASQLINRLQDHALGKIKMSDSQVKATAILLRKVLPDLAQVQLQGDRDNPLEHRVSFEQRQREAREAIAAAFEEHEPKMAAAVPPAIELRNAEGEPLPLARDFAQEGEAGAAPVPLPVRYRAPRATGGWGG